MDEQKRLTTQELDDISPWRLTKVLRQNLSLLYEKKRELHKSFTKNDKEMAVDDAIAYTQWMLDDGETINEFEGEYAFLSNYYTVYMTFQSDKDHRILKFRSAEACYQAQKNPDEAWKFQNLTADEAKKLGKNIKLRKDWNEKKLEVMERVVHEKFIQNPELLKKLAETGNIELHEGNWWKDTFWGDTYNYEGQVVGENHLGKILMAERKKAIIIMAWWNAFLDIAQKNDYYAANNTILRMFDIKGSALNLTMIGDYHTFPMYEYGSLVTSANTRTNYAFNVEYITERGVKFIQTISIKDLIDAYIEGKLDAKEAGKYPINLGKYIGNNPD